jgi:hypothetical protein
MATQTLAHRPGFYPQPNEWTCGPFALKHALVALGRTVHASEIAQTARTHWWSGTNEIRLARAARSFDCDLVLERSRHAEEARKRLIKLLRDDQVPVLLCVDEWTHWITVVGVEGNRFLVIDSEQDPVLTIHTWAQLRARWHYDDVDFDREKPPVLYDLHAIQPRFRAPVKADFSIDRIKFLRRPENRSLALYWNEYLEDLLEICKPAGRITNPISMAEFLRRHQELIVSRVVYWHGDIDRDGIVKILRNLRFVSEAYGLVIPAASTRRAAADLAILVTMWTVAVRGIDEMYGMGLGAVGGRQGLRRALRLQTERLNKVVRRKKRA